MPLLAKILEGKISYIKGNFIYFNFSPYHFFRTCPEKFVKNRTSKINSLIGRAIVHKNKC